jgi:HK97 family phage prohead protease
MEYRGWNPDEAEVRAIGDGMTFSGYAARFNSPSEWMGFEERIAPGAFTRTLKARNEVKAFLNHNTDIVLGSTRAGTLRLTQDDKGLLAEIDLPDTTAGRDLAVSVKRGDVSGMSFGFNIPKGGDEWSEDGRQRTLKEIALAEVSPVSGFPAYAATSASVRSISVPMLAHRCQEDADLLEVAVDALLMGEALGADAAALLRSVIDKMSEQPEEPTAEVTIEAEIPLSLLQKQLDLMGKGL